MDGGPKTEQLLRVALEASLSFRQQAEASDAWPGLLAYTDLIVADQYRHARQYELAQQFLDRARTTYKQVGDLAGLAICQMKWGDWLAAPYSTPVVWNCAIREGLQSNELPWTTEAAEFDQKSNARLSDARAAYTEAEQLFSESGARRGLAAVQLRYGYLATLDGNYDHAADRALEAQHGFEATGDQLGAWVARVHRALGLVGAGRMPTDTSTAQDLGVWAREEGSFSFALGLGILFSRVARRWMMRHGDYERALACHRLAEVLHTALGATNNQAQSLADQGIVFKAVGEASMAIPFYERALDLWTKAIETRPQLADEMRKRIILLGIDLYNLYEQKMDADGMDSVAARLNHQVAQVPLGDSGSLATVASMLSDDLSTIPTSSSMSESEALVDQFTALALVQSVRRLIEYASVTPSCYRAIQARAKDNISEMQNQFDLALAAARRLDEPERDFMEAVVFGHQRSYVEGATAYRRYLAHQGTGFTDTLMKVMMSFGGQGENEARLEQQRSHQRAAALFTRMKAYEDAKLHLDALEQLAGTDWWVREGQPWESLSLYGEVHEGQGQLQQALEYYHHAIQTLESRRRLLSRDELKTALASGISTQFLYFYAARTAVKLSAEAEQSGDLVQAYAHTATAFQHAEGGKARALLDLMAASTVLATSPKNESQNMAVWRQTTASLMRWRGLLAHEYAQDKPDADRINYLNQQIETDEVELRRIEAELAASDPDFYNAINPQASIMTLDEVCAALPPDTALLQYYFLDNELLAWSITGRQVRTHRNEIDVTRLEHQIQTIRRAYEKRVTLDTTLGVELADTLLTPLGDAIRESSKLIIVAYGAAHSLPFHALPWEGLPLINSRVVYHLPSASALRFLQPSVTHLPERILAVGNPAAMSYQQPFKKRVDAKPLQAAEAEASLVANLFSQGRALLGAQATENTVRECLGLYPLLHFATHGYLSEELPLLSSILLAEGEALSLYELMGLQLEADLVVMSACNTAQGERTRGDDVVGLTRGLLAAGARAAVVSLWPVDDVSTSLFMRLFYEALKAENKKADALQQAQLQLKGLTVRRAVNMCQEAKASVAGGGGARIYDLLDESIANLRFSAKDYAEARADYQALKRRLADGSMEAQNIQRRIAQCDLLIENDEATGPDGNYERSIYSHPYYWAPFILVGE